MKYLPTVFRPNELFRGPAVQLQSRPRGCEASYNASIERRSLTVVRPSMSSFALSSSRTLQRNPNSTFDCKTRGPLSQSLPTRERSNKHPEPIFRACYTASSTLELYAHLSFYLLVLGNPAGHTRGNYWHVFFCAYAPYVLLTLQL